MESVKISSLDHFKRLLKDFSNKLVQRIPKNENPKVQLFTDPLISMQYELSVVCCLITKSSGVDNYIIYVDNNNEVSFIRNIKQGDWV